MECRCDRLTDLYGSEAEAYVAEHLTADADGRLVCPDTGRLWALEERDGQPHLVGVPGTG